MAEQVRAEVLEDALEPLTRAGAWLAKAGERVAELAAQYPAPAEISDEQGYRDARANRAAARRDAKELDDERRRMTREMDDALKRFRGDVKDVLAPLTALDEGYKAALGEYEEAWRSERRGELLDAYEEYAPDLVPLVPLERLVERYGSERSKGWLQRSVGLEAAKAGLRGSIDSVAEGERTVAGAVPEGEAEEAKADFFSTLDAAGAIARAQERSRQRQRVRELEEARAAREAPLETGAVMSPEQAAEAWAATSPGQPAPNAILEHVAEAMGQPEPGRVPPYVFCAYGSEADASAFRAFCAQRGIKATVKPTRGSVYRIVRR